MATVKWNFTQNGNNADLVWETLTNGDVGAAFEVGTWNDITVQVSGTFNSQAITMQGSNDGTNWVTLTDSTGTDLVFTAAGGSYVMQLYKYIRPSFSGSSGGDVDVSVILRNT